MNPRRLLAAGRALAALVTSACVKVTMLTPQQQPQQPRAGAEKAPNPPAPAEERELYGIAWQPDLAAATRKARQTEPGKPIVLLRMLGKLDDKL
jgi:hypothetical protein